MTETPRFDGTWLARGDRVLDANSPSSQPTYIVFPTIQPQPARNLFSAVLRRDFWHRLFAVLLPPPPPHEGEDEDSEGGDIFHDAFDSREEAYNPRIARKSDKSETTPLLPSASSASSQGSASSSYRPRPWRRPGPPQPRRAGESHQPSFAERLFNIDPPERLLSGETWQVIEGRAHFPHSYQNGDGNQRTGAARACERVSSGIRNVGGQLENAGRRIADGWPFGRLRVPVDDESSPLLEEGPGRALRRYSPEDHDSEEETELY